MSTAPASSPPSSAPSERTSAKIAAWVASAGAVGGLVAWILPVGIPVTLYGAPWYLAIPAFLLVGAVAALLGVYLIANSDTAHRLPQTLAFALICGISWQAVLQSAQAIVNSSVTQKQVSALGEKSRELSQAVRSEPPQQVEAKVEATAETATTVLTKLDNVADPTLRADAVEQSKQAIASLERASETNPQAAIQALQRVGTTAANEGQTTLAAGVLSSLARIQDKHPDAKEQVQRAQSAIESSQP